MRNLYEFIHQQMTVYSDNLPSMHLTGQELVEFEEILRKDCPNAKFEFSFKHDGFTYNLDSAEEFSEEVDLPNTATEYNLNLRCKHGKIRIEAKKLFSGGNLRISGETEWVRKKERQINNYIESNRNLLRTFSSNIITGIYALEIIAWVYLVIMSSNAESEVSVSLVEGILATGLFLVAIGWPYALFVLIEFFYPYHLIKRDEAIKYRPRIKRLGKIAILILTVIGGFGGLITLIRFF